MRQLILVISACLLGFNSLGQENQLWFKDHSTTHVEASLVPGGFFSDYQWSILGGIEVKLLSTKYSMIRIYARGTSGVWREPGGILFVGDGSGNDEQLSSRLCIPTVVISSNIVIGKKHGLEVGVGAISGYRIKPQPNDDYFFLNPQPNIGYRKTNPDRIFRIGLSITGAYLGYGVKL